MYNLLVIEIFLTIGLTLLVLSVLVLIHELGHFVAARKLGVVAEEFGLGLPPFARKLFTWKGTVFTLNWLPIGGFVRMRGEDPSANDIPSSLVPRPSSLESEGFFSAQKPWKRAVILLAGVTMNALLGVLLFSVVYSVMGIPEAGKTVTIDGVVAGSPADQAQLRPSDVVLEMRDESGKLKVESTKTFVEFVNAHRGKEIVLLVKREKTERQTVVSPSGEEMKIEAKRGEEEKEITITPRTEADTPDDEGALGVAVSNIEFIHYPWWQMPFRASWLGIQEAVGWGINILGGLGSLGKSLFLRGQVPADLAGPVGIARITGKVAQQGWIPLMQFAGILSVNLAIVNVLPIPALDGGRLLFLGIEKLRGKPVNPKKEHWAHLAGYAVLIAFIVLITIRDLLRPAI